MTPNQAATADLPFSAATVLAEFVESARELLGPTLRSVVLYGSAAEGRLRPTSDLNLILVLGSFEPASIDRLREPMHSAQAAARLAPMFLLRDEVPAAMECFAAKFADVLRRRRVLFGEDPFEGLSIPREAKIARLRQVLLNLVLRLRASYALTGDREEHLAFVVADAAAPLRSCAATMLELEGKPLASGKEALRVIAAELAEGGFSSALTRLSEARESRALAPGTGGPTLLQLIDLALRMRARIRAGNP